MTEQEQFDRVQRMVCTINNYAIPETAARVTAQMEAKASPSREPNLLSNPLHLIDSYVAKVGG